MSRREGEEVVIRGSTKCQDCGNQAKKGCAYMRCRTCCKNKGFECETHVKSTWVPVDHRRRLHEDIPKRHKHNPDICILDREESKFPASMSLMARFRCVRVRSMDNSVNEYAYHTCVSIGGHVFSGLLYDQGSSAGEGHGGGDGSSAPPLLLQHHNLINASTQNHDGATMAQAISSSADTIFSPTYPFPFPLTTTFMPGMPYFSHPRP